jgi:hypothetical protein
MSHMSMILSGLLLMALLVVVSPGILALNRGKILRNIALWLAIFLGLALFYKNFGPGSRHPLFQMPEAMSGMNEGEAMKLPLSKTSASGKKDKEGEDQDSINNGSEGFIPPND